MITKTRHTEIHAVCSAGPGNLSNQALPQISSSSFDTEFSKCAEFTGICRQTAPGFPRITGEREGDGISLEVTESGRSICLLVLNILVCIIDPSLIWIQLLISRLARVALDHLSAYLSVSACYGSGVFWYLIRTLPTLSFNQDSFIRSSVLLYRLDSCICVQTVSFPIYICVKLIHLLYMALVKVDPWGYCSSISMDLERLPFESTSFSFTTKPSRTWGRN